MAQLQSSEALPGFGILWGHGACQADSKGLVQSNTAAVDMFQRPAEPGQIVDKASSTSPATSETPTKRDVHAGPVFTQVSGHRDPTCGSLTLAWGGGDRPQLAMWPWVRTHLSSAGLPCGVQTTWPSLRGNTEAGHTLPHHKHPAQDPAESA